jgi:cell division septation protein DedD
LCMSDSIPQPQKADEQVVAPQPVNNQDKTNSVDKYYIITGSLNVLEKANREVARLRGLGYTKAKLIPAGNNFRISIDEYQTESEAQANLPAIQQLFTGAWVLKPGDKEQ